MGIVTLMKDYERGNVKGWAGEDVAKYEWNLLKSSPSFKKFRLKGVVGATRKMMLFDITRTVLGKDTQNYAQEIGDCVSFGMKNAIEHLQCSEILLTKDPEEFKNIFPPYLYGIGRIYIGKGQLGDEDGSLGSWMADAVIKYGTVNSDSGVPAYAGNIAKLWGGPGGKTYLDKWVDLGKQHLVKSAAKIDTWDQLVVAVCNGYPVTIASNQGFNMKPDNKGFHQPGPEWAHQMCIIGVDDEYTDPYAIILNSWGDAHGVLKDFNSGKELPVGTLRVKKSVISHMLSSGEGFAVSNFDGFKTQVDKIEKVLFKLN